MLKAEFKKYTLNFNFPAGTSRGVLQTKDSWFIFVSKNNGKTGIGECGLLKGLSYDDRPGYESKLKQVCSVINKGSQINLQDLNNFPSIRFGVEMALRIWNVRIN